MTIHDRDKYRDAAWDWGILDGCFGKGKIRPSDIDGVVERNGHFLFIEAKPPSKELSTGQSILFERLAAKPDITVLILWGEKEKPEEMWVVGFEKQTCTLQGVRRFCRSWYTFANCEVSQWAPEKER